VGVGSEKNELSYKHLVCWNKNCKNNDGLGHCKLPHIGIDENGRCMESKSVKIETKEEVQVTAVVTEVKPVTVRIIDDSIFGGD